MDRPIWRDQEQVRTYDYLSLAREFIRGFGFAITDLLGGNGTMAFGLAATATSPASLVVNLTAGRIYQWAVVDATQYGDLGQDNTYTMQQGIVAAQVLTFTTTGLSAGQSRYALVQATFSQTDIIPTDDPNGGVLPYFNPNNPANPYNGPANSGASQSTRRTGACTVSIKYGAVATTGTEVAPTADSGYVGLYLVDLAYGQTQITQGQIATVPGAPFLAGLLNSHHSGGSGQAPKVVLTNGAEVQGTLPMANLPASSAAAGSGVAAVYSYAGNPNGHIPGVAGSVGVTPPDMCEDTTTGIIWVCKTTGTAATALWVSSGKPASFYPVTFEAGGPFTFPIDNNTETLWEIEGVAGGGGGGACPGGGNGSAGNGGNSGAYAKIIVKGFTAGQSATIAIGNGGAGGTSGNAGTGGGATTFTYNSVALLSLAGGAGGRTDSSVQTANVATVIATGLTVLDQRLRGAAKGGIGRYLGNSCTVSGGGGDNPLGKGGPFQTGGNVGVDADLYGGGGGGASAQDGTQRNGGAGANGVLIIRRLTL